MSHPHLHSFVALSVLCAFAVAAVVTRQVDADEPRALPDHPTFGKIERLVPDKLNALLAEDVKLEKLAEGFKWSEGPIWSREGFLVFSDIPRNRAMKWQNDKLSVYIEPSGYTGTTPRGGETGCNGLTMDHQGRLVLCQHGDRRIARREADGKITPLVEKFEGKRFNSPNDLCYKSNGDLYFTDPPYGMEKGWDDPVRELDFCGVYRLTPDGHIDLLTKELSRPNGIAFSPDEKTLYVSNSDPMNPIWMAYDVKADGTLGAGRVFFDSTPWVKLGRPGMPDGMKLDKRGNIFAAGPGGISIFSPDGTPLGRIDTGERTANCNWGDDGSTLYICANMYLCRIKTKAKGNEWRD